MDCEPEFEEFVDTKRLLGDKLGPLVFQFPHFSEADFGVEGFIVRLGSFLKRLEGTAVRFAIETRNKAWLDQEFADLLRQHRIALVLQDQGGFLALINHYSGHAPATVAPFLCGSVQPKRFFRLRFLFALSRSNKRPAPAPSNRFLFFL